MGVLRISEKSNLVWREKAEKSFHKDLTIQLKHGEYLGLSREKRVMGEREQ